jgi:hypothetical protein
MTYRDNWWRNKCALYAEKLRLTAPNRECKTRAQILESAITLELAGKLHKDLDAHEVLQELDRRVYNGDFTTKATQLIRKATA